MMARGRGSRSADANPSPFVKTLEFEALVPGIEFRVNSETGWFHFNALVTNSKGVQWVDAFGGSTGTAAFRSFTLTNLKRDRRNRLITRARPGYTEGKTK
jgi:hypothetical protein